MNRIHEVYQHTLMIAPQAVPGGGTLTSAYKKAPGLHDAMFVAVAKTVEDGKIFKVEIFQAEDDQGNGAAEITDCETIFTGPTGGATDVKLIVSLDPSVLGADTPYVAIKLTNDNVSKPVAFAEMFFEENHRGQDVNDDADDITVV